MPNNNQEWGQFLDLDLDLDESNLIYTTKQTSIDSRNS